MYKSFYPNADEGLWPETSPYQLKYNFYYNYCTNSNWLGFDNFVHSRYENPPDIAWTDSDEEPPPLVEIANPLETMPVSSIHHDVSEDSDDDTVEGIDQPIAINGHD